MNIVRKIVIGKKSVLRNFVRKRDDRGARSVFDPVVIALNAWASNLKDRWPT